MNNQKELEHFVAAICEPENLFVNFFKVENETGLAMAEKLYLDIIETESEETLLVIGGGNKYFIFCILNKLIASFHEF